MSADLSTTITLRGNKDELMDALKVIQDMTQGDEWYIESCYKYSFKNDEELEGIVDAANGEIKYNCDGPYGEFGFLDEVDIFEQIVTAVPTISLEGEIEGFTVGQSEKAIAKTQDGKLILRYYVCVDDSETYADYVEDLLSYEDFCDLFGIEYNEDDGEYYKEAIYDFGMLGMEYEEFNKIYGPNISKESFDKAMIRLEKMIITEEKYEEQFWGEDISFNPITGKYE